VTYAILIMLAGIYCTVAVIVFMLMEIRSESIWKSIICAVFWAVSIPWAIWENERS
jgi:heme/copper-type cytochrome/quinol oxidase subunit 4